jgi:hypothetical protein
MASAPGKKAKKGTQAKKAKKGAQSKKAKKGAQPKKGTQAKTSDWVMCRFAPEIELADREEPAEMLVCMTGARHAFPPVMIEGELDDAAWRCLVTALEQARELNIAPPGRIRVSESTLARALEGPLGDTDVEVVVGPTPEADDLMRGLETFIAEQSFAEPEVELPSSFFDEETDVIPEVVAATFERALQFRALRPWTFAAGHSMIRIDVPAFDLHDAHLAIVSDEGLGGWMITRVDLDDGEDELAQIPEFLALGFVPHDDLDEDLQAEVREHALPVDPEGMVPLLFAGGLDTRRRALSYEDYVLASIVLEILVHFLPAHRGLFEDGVPREAEATYAVGSDEERFAVTIAAVHESFFDEADLHAHGEVDEEDEEDEEDEDEDLPF